MNVTTCALNEGPEEHGLSLISHLWLKLLEVWYNNLYNTIHILIQGSKNSIKLSL